MSRRINTGRSAKVPGVNGEQDEIQKIEGGQPLYLGSDNSKSTDSDDYLGRLIKYGSAQETVRPPDFAGL